MVTRPIVLAAAAMAVVVLTETGGAHGAVVPGGASASATIDGISYAVPVTYDPASSPLVAFGNASSTGQSVLGNIGKGATISTLSAIGNVDPFIVFAVSVVDDLAPSTFAFAFSIPLAPDLLSFPAGTIFTVHSTLGVTLTATPGHVNTITPNVDPISIMLNNVGSCAAGVDIGTTFSAPASTSVTQSFSATNSFTPIPGCSGTLDTLISFIGSGNSAAYGLTGLFEISVPEPASFAVLGAGVLALTGMRRRRSASVV